MAKKQLDDDLLTGKSISSGDDKSAKKAEKLAKKAEKKAAKAKKIREKNEAKRAQIKKEIDALKASKASETDSQKIDDLDKKIKALTDKYSAVGSSKSLVAPKTAKIIKSALCIVIVIALLSAYVATGAVRKGLIADTGLPARSLTGLTVDNGAGQKAKIKVATYNFYFAMAYNNLRSTQQQYQQYGLKLEDLGMDVDFDKPFSKQMTEDPDDEKKEITWEERLHKQVVDSIKTTYTYYLEAVKANDGKDPEITDEQKKELKDTLDEYKKTAEKAGYTLSAYLTLAMGEGVTESVFKTEVTRQYIAQNYEAENKENLSKKEYKEAEYKKYKNEHKDDLESVDIKLFECSNEDDAKAFAKELKADGSNFADLAVKYTSSDFEKTLYKDEGNTTEFGITKPVLKNAAYAIATADEHKHKEGEEHSDDEVEKFSGLDWLFSKERKAGDVKQYSTTVVYVISPASINEDKTVNVRHILIAPETEDDKEAKDATAKQWADAKKKADKILKEWKNGKKTEDSFAELAEKNSADTGSKDNGGLCENVVPGQMVKPFAYWSLNDARKAGDTAIVKTEYGYHIMYFVEKTDMTVWEYTAQQALASSDSEKDIEKLEDSYKADVKWFGSRYFEKDIDIDN